MTKYRTRLDIIADILSVAGGSARKTRIMFGANLSFDLANRYLAEVLKAGLVSLCDDRFYSLTQRGKEYLKTYSEYSRLKKRAEEQADSIAAAAASLQKLSWGDTLRTAPTKAPRRLPIEPRPR